MHKKLLTLTLKITLSLIAIYLVIGKIDIEETKTIFTSLNYYWLILGLFFFTLSRVIGALRLNLYFSQIGLNISEILNLKLYYLGMFYNLFLPGGIGGDGYKIFFLHKHFQIKKTSLLKATVLDRISGLFALLFLVGIFFSFSSFTDYFKFNAIWAIILACIMFPLSYLFTSIFSKTFLTIFTSSTVYAVLVQGLQVISALFILYSLNENAHIFDYLTIFLISSVVAVLPISIGGIGARELTFIYLLGFLNQEYTIGIALSIIFFLYTFFSSLWGVVYMHLNPNGANTL